MSPPSALPAAQFSHVTKRFGTAAPVIADFSLTADPGDFISLIGPSGCGKSTLLRLLSGLTPLSSGTLTADPDLAYIFQDPTLLPWLNVADNVEALLRLRHLPAAERAARRDVALAQVRLPDLAHRYPRQLSGGQKMRVSIARALTLRPRLLLLDEPFGALDELTRDLLNEELLALREAQHWTAFFVTHSVAEAVFLSNRILILAPGHVTHELKIDLPYPRTADTRRSPAYLALVAEVSQTFRTLTA
jgi:NitT/TauT family transport system ATP-binding protein